MTDKKFIVLILLFAQNIRIGVAPQPGQTAPSPERDDIFG